MTTQLLERKRIPGSLLLVPVLLGIAIFINYIDRGNLSIAAPMLKDELGLSGKQLGMLLSAFFWTYSGMLLISGWIVDRFNVNWVLAGGFFLWSAATAATGAVQSFTLLIMLRLILGIGESVAFPSCSKIIALSVAEEHRGFANSVIASGLLFGPGFGIVLGGNLMARFGWRPFFIVLGLGSMLWLVPWLKLKPRTVQAAIAKSTDAPNFFEFLQLRSAWGTTLGLVCSNCINFFLLTWMPYYLVRERGFSMQSMATIGGAAYVFGALAAIVSGRLSDRWITSGATPTLVRKTFVAGGTALCGITFALCPLGGAKFSAALLVCSTMFMGVCASNVWAITQRLAGQQAAGRWTGFQAAFGSLAGVIIPALTGFVIDYTGHFERIFPILTLICAAGSLFWIFLVGPIEQVTWGKKRATAKVAAAG